MPTRSDRLPEGLYDTLLTRRLRALLARLSAGFTADIVPADPADQAEYLSRLVGDELRRTLAGQPAAVRLALANALLGSFPATEEAEQVEPPLELLRAVYRGPAPPRAPSTPLGAHSLHMNALDEPRLGFELERELASADSVAMIVSFLQWRGWQRLKPAFEALAARGAPVRILTTTYIGATDLAAVTALAALPNVELRISLDGRRRRLHAKAWLFERHSGFGSVYVGSANLSQPALEDGIEWTVKLSEAEGPRLIERFRGAFESLWCDEEFERFDPADPQQRARVAAALAEASPTARSAAPALFFDLRPRAFQQATLDRLEAERLDRGCFRNLVVAPTGTGKTMVAAFDYARQPYRGPRPRLLFLAHREELLRQARDSFRHVLRDESFGEILAGGSEPASYHHLFASIQSVRARGLLAHCGADFWEYAVLDEAHHAPAESYRELLTALRPRLLLGLTATPERTDGESILPWFDHRVADEMRLWHAVERQYLAAFDYYGIHDGTDFRRLHWSRGAYAVQELEQNYLANHRRAALVVQQFAEIHGRPAEARAIAFCVSVRHARFMAEVFTRAGIPAAAVTGETPAAERADATRRLRAREVNVLCTVDLFNEGVDIPEVDCVLFLRPTESATVFLQQLGRGLRLAPGKTSCLVLDFLGLQRQEFRFDLRYIALFGGTRRQLEREIETGITRLPGNCYFRLDRESRQAVLDHLRAQLRGTRAAMVAELRRWPGTPSLAEFVRETGYGLEEIYKPSAGGWTALLAAAGRSEETPSALPLGRLLHLDAVRALRLYLRWVEGEAGPADELERRLAMMLTARLYPRPRGLAGDAGLAALRADRAALAESRELFRALLDGTPRHAADEPLDPGCPLFLHRSYFREEVLAAMGRADWIGARHTQTGCLWIPEQRTEIFFVTLDKSERSFSPSTRYEDFAVSPTRFHWQSQSTVGESSPAGQRYVGQAANGVRFLLLVRPRPGEPFVNLGPVRYVSHSGGRPMSIYWDLAAPIPAALFTAYASLRAA